MKIFIFWIGDKNKIAETIFKLEKMGFTIHLGPTADEHSFLMKNFDFYRLSYEQKKWAFCSDVWRLYMLSNNKGMYIDTSCVIGDNLPEFYRENIKFHTTFFKETPETVANCIMLSGENDNKIFSDILEKYKIKIPVDVNTSVFPISPFVITASLYNVFDRFYTFDQQVFNMKGNQIKIGTLLEIRDPKRIKKVGAGSWGKKGSEQEKIKHSNLYWDRLEDAYRKLENANIYNRPIEAQAMSNELIFWIWGMREAYDTSSSKSELELIRVKYSKLEYKIKISEWLIWSKLYRIFTHKKNS